MDLNDLRKNYDRGELDETDAPDAPLVLFEKWFAQAVAAGIPEPSAMTLATVSAAGRPSTRVVLLKSIDAAGLVFFTNYESRKAEELDLNPAAAAQFHWVAAEQVIRVEGSAEKVSAAESDAYFASRPLDSRIGAWASPQSQVIANRGVLLANAAKATARYGTNPPRPQHWGGYRLVPESWEFWQGRKSRLHDRIRFRRSGGDWEKERLAP